MQDPRNLSWNQFNEARRFPLLHGCTPVSVDGHFMIPDDLFTGLYISHSIVDRLSDPVKFYIKKFTYFRTGFTIEIYYDDAASTKLAEVTIDLATEPKPQVATLLGFDNAFLYGYVVLGQFGSLEQQPAGEWEFAPAATTLDPFCLRPVARELSVLYVRNDNKTIGPFTGEITLVAGERINLEVKTVSDLFNCLENPVSNTGTEVTIHAQEVAEDFTGLRTINGVKPDIRGNIDFIGKQCMKITPLGASTIQFEDICSQPCCSCTELAPIETAIADLKTSILEMKSRISTLETHLEFLSRAFTLT
jgi:hypothetical protein